MASTEDDQVIDAIGEIGPWQWRWFLLSGLVTLPTAFPALVTTFLAAPTDFWCEPPAGYVGSVDAWRNASSPLVSQGGKEVRDQCSVWDTEDFTRPADNATQKCSSWQYDRSEFDNTIVQFFDLVCERQAYSNLHQSVYFLGLLLGVLAAGIASDVFGRKRVLFPVVFGMAFFGTLTVFMPSIEAFIAMRFLQGFSTIGVFAVAFVWVMETVDGKWKTIFGIGYEAPWVIGWFLLALVAYITPDWRHIQLITSVPGFVCAAIVWFMPESPKWLLCRGRVDEAEKIVREAADFNGLTLARDWKLKPLSTKAEEEGKGRATLLDLFKHKNLAIKTLILYFNWFANSFVYYGLTLNSGSLGGTIMVNFLLNGLMEIPAYTFSLFILLKKGRKLPYASMMVVGGIALFCTTLVPRDVYAYNWPQVVLAMIGKLMISGKKKNCETIAFEQVFFHFESLLRHVRDRLRVQRGDLPDGGALGGRGLVLGLRQGGRDGGPLRRLAGQGGQPDLPDRRLRADGLRGRRALPLPARDDGAEAAGHDRGGRGGQGRLQGRPLRQEEEPSHAVVK